MRTRLSVASLALAFSLTMPGHAFGQAKPDPKGTALTTVTVTTPAKAVAAPSKTEAETKAEEYEKAIKGLTKTDGPMSLYQRKNELLMEVPESKLGKLFLVQVTLDSGLDSGFMHAGMPVGDNAIDAFRLDRHDGNVWLVRPNISHRWDKSDPFAVGAERSFQEAILGSYKIEQENPAKKLLLVNVTTLFFGDTFHLNEMIMQGLGGPYMMDREKSGVDKIKGFPTNSVVQMRMHYSSPRGAQPNPLAALFGFGSDNTLEDSRSAPLKVTYSLWWRNEDGYVPRYADPRIGYFQDSFFAVERYLNQDRTERYINRFHLEKKDPKAAISEAIKPIVFTIDPSIPAEYRQAVKEGVLRWNRAFEGLGYKNAVQVQDVPKDDKDYDHADGRYNVIRMLVSPSSPFGAISLFRTDPFTGEILNASITLDGNIIRDLQEEHLRNQGSYLGATKAFQALTRDQNRTETEDHLLFTSPVDQAKEDLVTRMRAFGWGRGEMCSYALESADQAQMAWPAIEAAPNHVNKEQYVKEFLADCVSHEMGHCLGLRHNFAGSTNLSTAQLADDGVTAQQGISASVMDYTPPNVQAVLKGHGNFYTPTVGPYDIWAIKYGYQDFGAKTPDSDKYQLSQIAAQSGKHGYAYESDEDADRFDPYAVRFDASSDPLDYSQKVVQSLKRARSYAITNMPNRGESYAKRTDLILTSIIREFREGRNAARFVGGMAENKNFHGDSNEHPTLAPVDPALQRQAMHLIASDFLSPSAFDLPTSVLTTLSTDENNAGWTAPLRLVIGSYQDLMVALLLSSGTTDRITENAYKTSGCYDMDEHFRILRNAVFQEVGHDSSIRPLRRDLQRFTLNAFMTIASAPSGAVNEDDRMLSEYSLKQLRATTLTQLKRHTKLDNMTRIHLQEMSDSIGRFLTRQDVGSR